MSMMLGAPVSRLIGCRTAVKFPGQQQFLWLPKSNSEDDRLFWSMSTATMICYTHASVCLLYVKGIVYVCAVCERM
jgi:hypothetical protein